MTIKIWNNMTNKQGIKKKETQKTIIIFITEIL